MSTRKQLELLVGIASIAIAVIAWQFRFRFPFDDTFISFRYAEHLASGYGLVWNIGGAHTEGYTNFLFVVLLAASRFATNDLLASAQIIGLATTSVTALALYRLTCVVRNHNAAVVVAAFFVFAPLTWINALSGMETSLFVMLVVLSLLAVSVRRLPLAYALVVLATLTRPEGAILGALFLLLESYRPAGLKSIRVFLLAFALPLAVYAVWKYLYFGYLLPNSFYIKVSESSKLLPGLQYVRLFGTSVIALIVATFGIRSRRTHLVLVVATLWSFSLLLFYLFVTPLEGLYDRFLWPCYAALCFTGAVGLHDISARLQIRALPWGILLLSFAIMTRSPRTRESLFAHEDIWDASMERIAMSLRALPESRALTLAYGDAGYVVYRSGLRHLDLFGLNDTRIAHARSTERRADIVRSERPDLMLLPIRDSSGCNVFVEDAYGVANDSTYEPIAACDVFPYKLVLLSNRGSQHANDIALAIDQQLTSSASIWKSPPVLCRH